MTILTLEQAVAQGSTASELRVLTNSLDRIARDGYVYEDQVDDNPQLVREPPYDYRACQENAAALRRLAGQLQRRK